MFAATHRFNLALGMALGVIAFVQPGRSVVAADQAASARVEVVFCLDTTGSMGGLIEGAKQKIWAICNQIAGGKPTPQLKIGLVAFRDRGDVYITKIIDLTDDLDAIHEQLRGFRAEGGGDEPESVNQALAESISRVSWSRDPRTLRILFLVGDAPPHMDYPDDVKYPVSCRLAAEKGIIINTVQCGLSAETRKYWQDICRRAEGSYVQIPQDGGVVAVATPFDRDLEAVNVALTKTTLTFGDVRKQERDQAKATEAMAMPAAAGGADRAAYAAKNGSLASYDLLDNLKNGRVQLKDLPKAQLPVELQKLDAAAQRTYLNQLDQKRNALRQQALELDRKRSAFMADERAKRSAGHPAGFDLQILQVLRQQAGRFGIHY